MTQQEWLAECARREKVSEGCKLIAYPDPLSGGDPWTIGYGHTGPEVKIGTTWSQAQAEAALLSDLSKYVAQARASLPSGVYDALSDARRFVVMDLCYNMGDGPDGWGGFTATHALITSAVRSKVLTTVHALYGEVADHLVASSWIAQTGDRARRGIAMMRSSNWCSPTGNGSDVL